MDAMLALVPAELAVSQILTAADQITIWANSKELSAWCPTCERRSHRVHSRYDRRLADLPWQGRAVAIAVTVRRFRCDNALCERRIFVEQLPKVMAPHSRRSRRLAEIQLHIGMALGGAAGGRLARRLASESRHTAPIGPAGLARRSPAIDLDQASGDAGISLDQYRAGRRALPTGEW